MSWTADEAYLVHHGVKGQRWGVRRFQEKDGDYTAAGRARYGVGKATKNTWQDDMRSGNSKNYSGKIRRELNREDQKQTNLKAEIDDRIYGLRNMQFIKSNAEKRNNQKAIDRIQKRIDRQEGKINTYSEAIRDSKLKSDRLIKDAEKAGYTVDSKYIARCANTGSDLVAALSGVIVIRDPYVGRAYSVKKNESSVRGKINEASKK